jgi:hypothetical protein
LLAAQAEQAACSLVGIQLAALAVEDDHRVKRRVRDRAKSGRSRGAGALAAVRREHADRRVLLVGRRWREAGHLWLSQPATQAHRSRFQSNAEAVALRGAASGLVLDRTHQNLDVGSLPGKGSPVRAQSRLATARKPMYRPVDRLGLAFSRAVERISLAPAGPAGCHGAATSGELNELASF